ncbi:hypothetical protein lerEdw1_004306 [Lerista edwardsae]|nr:hypothetical protein lerEdw1_004306 [Lerista edwardsae]
MESNVIPEASSLFTFGDIKRCVREKKNGPLKFAKLNTSLASKIKTKVTSNSTLFKTSLKLNNKALAMALSTEKENSRRLKNEKLLLQKEVNELHVQNVLLCRKLNYLNKTLIEIKAFLNNNLLTAIEVSTLSECVQKHLALEGNQCNSIGHQPEIFDLPVRSIKICASDHFALRHDGKQQDNISVCEGDTLFKQTTILSKETGEDEINIDLLTSEKNIPKSNAIDKTETIFATNTCSGENQSCVKQTPSGTFMLDLNKAPSVEDRHSRAHNNNPFPTHEYVTERKKQAMSSLSNVQSISNFDTKTDPNSMFHCDTGKVLTTHEMGNQIAPNGVGKMAHTEPSSQLNNEPTLKDKVHFINDQKPEETVYDTDMELTASELGEILIVKSKDKDKSANIVKADKLSTNLRKVCYSRTEKQIKKKHNSKPKKHTEKVLNSRKVKKISTTEPQNSEPQKKEQFQRKTTQEMKVKSTSEHDVGDVSINSNKKNKWMHLGRLSNLKSPQTTNILQNEDIKDNSETVKNSDNQAPEQDFDASNSKVPRGYCIESLPFAESHIFDITTSKQDLLAGKVNSKPTMKKMTYLVDSNYSGKENKKHLKRNLKGCGSKECEPENQTKPDQNTNITIECSNKEVNCRTSEKSAHSLVVPNTDKINEEFSQGDARRIFAKASRKTYIIRSGSLKQKKN